MSDDGRSLLLRHREGDQSAFPCLLQKYRKQVFSYLIRTGVPESFRDDLFQEIFLKVHKHAFSYNEKKLFEPWLFTVVANTARSHFRSHARKEQRTSEYTDSPALTPSSQSTQEARETEHWLEEQISLLPLAQREVIILCCAQDMLQSHAAKALGIPLNTLKTRLRRAKATLGEALESREKIDSEACHE